MKHKNTIIRLFAIIGALFYARATKAQEKSELTPRLSVFAAVEQDGTKKNHAEVLLKPELKWEKDRYKVGYYGSFYRSKDNDGSEQSWKTLNSEIRLESEEWRLDVGRINTRQYSCATTTSFDNRAVGKGANRTYTGIILTHKNTGLSLGQVSNEARITANHWNGALLGWQADLNEQWGLQLQGTIGQNVLRSAGATLKWQPTEATSVMADYFYQNHEKTGSLTANHKLTDRLTLFTGTQITFPQKGKSEGLANLGVNYDIGKGFQFIAAAQQELGKNRVTSAILGLKYSKEF